MINALPHQQQPPKPASCVWCGERFNNSRRLQHHIRSPKHEDKFEAATAGSGDQIQRQRLRDQLYFGGSSNG